MNIHGVPEVTHEGAEDPLAGDLQGGAERHGQQGHAQVSTGQRNQEIVVHMPQPSVEDHADNDKDVVDDCQEDDADEDDALGYKKSNVQICMPLFTGG